MPTVTAEKRAIINELRSKIIGSLQNGGLSRLQIEESIGQEVKSNFLGNMVRNGMLLSVPGVELHKNHKPAQVYIIPDSDYVKPQQVHELPLIEQCWPTPKPEISTYPRPVKLVDKHHNGQGLKCVPTIGIRSSL